MALPGLQVNAEPFIEEQTSTVHELREGTEWRFEVAFGDSVEVKLISGTAELFGTELALNQTYTFNGRKAAVYTWHGCRLEVTGSCQSDYVAEETPMTSYVNVHFALENMRSVALDTNTTGPRILVVGPENAGKTSLVKTLAAYAMRSGRQPVAVNLDPKEGLLSVPGTLTAVALDSILDVEEGWGSSPTNGPSQIPVKLPLVYYYGQEDAETQKEIYKPLVTRLALSTLSRLDGDAEAKHSGCIIDAPGSISLGKGGYEVIQHIVSEFSVNILLVLGSERLYSDMTRRFAKAPSANTPAISVLKLDKSGGCVDRDGQYLQQMRHAQIREYFFGDARNTLSPHIQQIDFSDVVIYRVSEQADLMQSLLPGGDIDSTSKPSVLEMVQPSAMMQNCLLAIVQAEATDSQENIRDASVIGFVHVSEVDEKKRKMKVLAPLSGRLPRRVLIWGNWPEAADLAG